MNTTTYISYPVELHAQAPRGLPFSCEPCGAAFQTPHDVDLLCFDGDRLLRLYRMRIWKATPLQLKDQSRSTWHSRHHCEYIVSLGGRVDCIVHALIHALKCSIFSVEKRYVADTVIAVGVIGVGHATWHLLVKGVLKTKLPCLLR